MDQPLRQDVTAIKGVGKERSEELASLGIHTIGDVLDYFPYRYEDTRIQQVEDLQDGEKTTLKVRVYSEPSLRFYGKKKSRLSVRVVADTLVLQAVWFNRHFLKKQLSPGKELYITGKWDQRRRQITVASHVLTGSKKAQEWDSLQPVYSVGGSLSSGIMRKLVRQVLTEYGEHIPEILPSSLVSKYKLMPRQEAVRLIHFPEGMREGRLARRRMVYEELFLFQLKMQVRKWKRKKENGVAQVFSDTNVERFKQALSFSLTVAQERVLQEILRDMRSDLAMNRLLQGDVGSGKTVVAVIALYASVQAGHQAALMVPTEILAEQHLQSLKELLGPHDVSVALLSGSATDKQRRDILGQLQMGLVDVVVGTHALIQEDVVFQRLGLVITDEQHRFGVRQRKILREKGWSPDVLFMTATPIPRTMAISVFGDMDVSTIDELPAGRKPVKTYWAQHDMFDRVFRFVREELAQGRQAYVVCPLIEESDKLDVQNAIDFHTRLKDLLAEYEVGLMHGRLPLDEKEETMRRFTENRVQLLVSTTVVEVGVNVPNASIMVIYDAERFGLAQLHQLRGRVGRGNDQAYCVLIADPKTEVGKERMRIMTETNDGFKVARKDLELRGPGDFFGTKQSGLPEFQVADLVEDFKVLEYARADVEALIRDETFWRENSALQAVLEKEGALESKRLD